MASIFIKRTKEFNDRGRNYTLMLNNAYAGTIANGQTVELETTPGIHTLVAKIDWCSSPVLTIDTNNVEKVTIEIGGFKYAKWLYPISGGILALHFILKIFFNIQFLIYLVMPFFITLLYYLTVGRRNYLTIKNI